MYCQHCGQMMRMLPPLYFATGKDWYGCDKCNAVTEYNHDSMSGKSMGTEPCRYDLKQYEEIIAQKEAREAEEKAAKDAKNPGS